MDAEMARAYQILETFTEEELRGFLMMFGHRQSGQTEAAEKEETKAERMERRRAAADRIIARRPVLPPDFDEKLERLDDLDERYGAGS